MAEILGLGDYCISLVSIHSEQDLEPWPGLANINAPPSDGRCTCCGRHINDLKPFGKAGDPLVGDFEGALLVKKWRPIAPVDEEAERICEEYLDRAQSELRYEGAAQRIPADYGTEEADGRTLEVAERTGQLIPPVRLKKMKDELSRLIIAEQKEQRVLPANCGMEQAGPIAFAVTEKAESPSLAVMERAAQLMARDLGTEVAERILGLVCDASGDEARWECRDCIVLNKEEYFEKRRSRMATGPQVATLAHSTDSLRNTQEESKQDDDSALLKRFKCAYLQVPSSPTQSRYRGDGSRLGILRGSNQ